MTNSDYCDSIDYRSSPDYLNSPKEEQMKEKILDSEIKVMENVWESAPVAAKDISVVAAQKIGWNKNTTYTVIKKLEEKGYIKREDPGFVCTSLVSRDAVRKNETKGLVERLFGGSKKALFSALLEDEELTGDDIEELRRMIDKR